MAGWFGRFLQYTPGLEVFTCSFDTDFNYVTTVLQLHLSLNHQVKLRQLLGGRWISQLAFWVLSQRQMCNPSSALFWTQGPLLNIPEISPAYVFEIHSWISCSFCLFVFSLYRLFISPAWLLALTLCMFASIHFNFCVFIVLSSNYFGHI